ADAPPQQRNSHALGDLRAGNFRLGHPTSTPMLRGFESQFCRGDMSDVSKTIATKTIASWRTPALVIGFGSLIALIAFGPRSTLGFFLTPLSSANHWVRDVFAFALALQNLLWGVGQPLGGVIAERFGRLRVLGGG